MVFLQRAKQTSGKVFLDLANSHFHTVFDNHGKSLCDTANVMIELATHKNLILVVSQSKIGPEMGYLAWTGIGPKLSHYWARKRIQKVPKVIQKCQ